MQSPDPDHTVVEKDGYEVTFHPGFLRECGIERRDGDPVGVYRRTGTFHFEEGKERPQQHRIRLRGGAHGRDLSLLVDDPRHQVARITVELYDPEHEPGSGKGEEPVETASFSNGGPTCPPVCPPNG